MKATRWLLVAFSCVFGCTIMPDSGAVGLYRSRGSNLPEVTVFFGSRDVEMNARLCKQVLEEFRKISTESFFCAKPTN